MRFGLIHYTFPPVVGGVEFVALGQAVQFAEHGHPVRMIGGAGRSDHPGVECRVLAELGPDWPRFQAAARELASGRAGSAFKAYQAELESTLRREIADLDAVLAHNVMTMHFNPALTAALWNLAQETASQTAWYFWAHDLVLAHPDYPRPDVRRHPWSLYARVHPTAHYVTISEFRRRQLSKELRIPPSQIRLVPDGIDARAHLEADPEVWRLFLEESLADQDLVLLFPTRVVRRKNLALAVHVTGSLKRLGKKAKLLITGAPDAHNPSSVAYFEEVRELIRRENLQAEVLFVADRFRVGFRQLCALYRLADALIMTSRQEGFGLPLLEAGVHHAAVICPRVAPFTDILGSDGIFFPPNEKPERIARRILRAFDSHGLQGARRHFKRVLREYSWVRIWEKHLSTLALRPRSWQILPAKTGSAELLNTGENDASNSNGDPKNGKHPDGRPPMEGSPARRARRRAGRAQLRTRPASRR
ncbi:MAG: glycosyltransferase [Verrucomicrobiae bacterium]|nr:glycosyltransferase [Verrucomicrobiae bacterium]